jgi:hypothetical protein
MSKCYLHKYIYNNDNIMIKTFEQFSLCEGISPKMKRIDFEGEYATLINKLTIYIIEYICCCSGHIG